MRRVYATGSLQEAELIRVFLRQNGIESILENEFTSNVTLSPTAVPLIVTVSDQDEAGALHVIRKHLARREKAP